MTTISSNPANCAARTGQSVKPQAATEVSLLTGGGDKPYAFGLALALVSKGLSVEFIGSEGLDSPQLHEAPTLTFLNLQEDQRPSATVAAKVLRILLYYARLIKYVSFATSPIFHILWNNKFQLFDRTLLMCYYKLLGKYIVLTAHNVNVGKRDQNDSILNRLTLRIQYHLADHIFVHTDRMKTELLTEFRISQEAVSVIPFGVNNCVPRTGLSCVEAKRRLGIGKTEKAILFFGAIGPYKGLEYLVTAFERLAAQCKDYRLIIAGRPMKGCQEYFRKIEAIINREGIRNRITQRIEFVPDEDTELYFKGADLLVLPYTRVFQSGVLFLGYSFGLPVVATDVGAFAESIVEGETGFLSPSTNPSALAAAIERYFASDLYRNLEQQRVMIEKYVNLHHSWDTVGEKIVEVYSGLLDAGRSITAKH